MFEDIAKGIAIMEKKAGKISLSAANKEEQVELFYSKLEEMGYNLDELKGFFELGDKRALAIACAGGGKTTAIVLKLIKGFIDGSYYMQVDTPQGTQTIPKKIWVATFLKTGAEAIMAELRKWCTLLGVQIPLDSINVTTLHSEFLAVLQIIMLKNQNDIKLEILPDNERMDIIKGQMKRLNIRSKISQFVSQTVTIEEVSKMSAMVTHIKNYLGAERFNHEYLEEFSMTPKDLEFFYGEYETAKQYARVGLVLDFDDINLRLSEILQTAGISQILYTFLNKRYDVIFLDEFQDTSQVQYMVLRAYIDGVTETLVVGDDDQTIYSWRASDINIITHRFVADYNPVILHLSSNYRCGSNILNYVKSSIEHNKNRHPKDLRAAKKETGNVYEKKTSLADFYNSLNELGTLSDDNTLGIVGRINLDLIIPAILLELRQIEYTVSSRLTLNTAAYKIAMQYMQLYTSKAGAEGVSVLKDLVPYADYDWRSLKTILQTNPDYTIFTIPLKDVRYSCGRLYNFIEDLQKIHEKVVEGDEESEKKAMLMTYNYIISIYTQKKESPFINKVIQFMRFFVGVVSYGDCEGMSVARLDKYFNTVLPACIGQRSKVQEDAPIRLTTVHDAKGKEWDNVFVWNDIEGSFPSGKVDEIGIAQYEEERRIHYIACTRAKKKLYIFTHPQKRSPFLFECDKKYLTQTTDKIVIDKIPVKEIVGVNVNIQARISEYLHKNMVTGTDNEEMTEVQSLLVILASRNDIQELLYNEIIQAGGYIDFTNDKFIDNAVYNLYEKL